MKKIKGLYAIADDGWNPCASLSKLALKFLEGGCRVIQLRMKGADPSQILNAAKEIAAFKKERDFMFIVNDHADIAAEAGADGVHVGENDTAIGEIKNRFGREFIAGYSAHSVEEAIRAERNGADYVAFGAIFPTKTKGPGHPVQGLDKLREVVKSASVPVVAIGGIGRGNIQSVIETGAGAIAMISALAEAKDIVTETNYFVERFKCPK